jgi:hypothetical protein
MKNLFFILTFALSVTALADNSSEREEFVNRVKGNMPGYIEEMSSYLHFNRVSLAKACNAAGAVEGILLASESMKIDLKEVYKYLGSDSGWDDKTLKEVVLKVSLKCEE